MDLTTIPIPPIAGRTGNFDGLDIDQEAHLLYVADRVNQGVDIFDVASPQAKYLRTVDVGSPPNGLLVVKDQKKVYVGNNDSTVAVIDVNPASPKVNTVIARLNMGGQMRADEMDYNTKDKKLYVANTDNFVSVIDVVGDTIVKKIANIGQTPEQVRYNHADGMIYVDSANDNSIYQIDPAKDEMVAKTEVGVPCEPHGLAVNPVTNQGVVGCANTRTQQTVTWDFKAGRLLGATNQVGAGDVVIYNAKADRFLFAVQNDYRGPQIGIFGGSPVKFLTNVPTVTGTHSVAYETNKIVYAGNESRGEAGLVSFPLPSGS